MTTSPHVIRDDLDLGISVRDVASDDQAEVVVVLTTRGGRHRPEFDAEELARQVPEARVLLVPAHLSARVARRLGDDLGVFNGAARVYPVRKQGQPYEAPVFTTQFRPAEEVFPALVQATKDAVARAAHKEARPIPNGSAAVAATPALPQADPAGVTRIDTAEMARAFAQHLLEPSRSRPTLLVTRRAGSATPEVDVARIVAEVGGLVDVFEMGTGDVSWAFAEALAGFPGAECYGGAARVYPVGLEWTTNLARSPLRFTWSAEASEASTRDLIRDALAATRASGYETTPETSRPAAGRVQGSVSERILVMLDGGGAATIWPELTARGVEAEHLAVPGMRVTGLLDEAAGRLDVTSQLVPAREALASYRAGDLVLGRVVAVERELAVLELYPDVQVALTAEAIITGRFLVDVRQWLSEGETVVTRVVRPGESPDDWELSLLDVDPDEVPLPAPSLLPDGPPWLAQQPLEVDEGVEEPAEPLESDAPAPMTEPLGVAGVHSDEGRAAELAEELRVMTAERDALARQLAREREAAGRLDHELKTLRTRARDLEGKSARAAKQLAAASSKLDAFAHARADRELDRVAFLDPEEQFRYEVDLEWARRIPASEKKALPKGRFRLSPGFLATFESTDERDRAKAVEVVVDVITGRVHDLAGRQTHQLRSGPGGDDPFLTRDDGATCWRVSLQHKTPQARRLHYWALPDGTSEFSSVRTHDDFRP